MPEGPEQNVTELPIIEEMQDSYLTYAMSVIMSRALPDARDGLKPSQRRILVARARGIDAYGSGPLPKQYASGRADMLKFAITLWSRILKDGQDAEAVQQARGRIPLLRKRLAEIDKGNGGKKSKDGR